MFTRADEIKQFDGYLDEKNKDGEGRKGRWSRRKRDKEEEVGGVKKMSNTQERLKIEDSSERRIGS